LILNEEAAEVPLVGEPLGSPVVIDRNAEADRIGFFGP